MSCPAAGDSRAVSLWFVSMQYRCVGSRLSATATRRQDRTTSGRTSSSQTQRRPVGSCAAGEE